MFVTVTLALIGVMFTVSFVTAISGGVVSVVVSDLKRVPVLLDNCNQTGHIPV